MVELQRKVTKMENDNKQIRHIMDGMISCRAPSTNYNMYLEEILLMFKTNVIIIML